MPIVPQGPLEGAEYFRWKTIREDDDQVTVEGETLDVLRASIGGNEEIGFYFTFRGNPEEIAKMLEMVGKLATEVAAGRASYQDNRTRRP